MPRGPRSDAPAEIHHVWVRGIERRAIFRDERDRFDLVARLTRVLPESDVRCLGWSLLPNHYHLVLKRGPVALSRVMARINSGYATRFNRRHERAGFLFQNRFGSRVVDSDADLIAVVRYVVHNPLKHGICRDQAQLAAYPWGSISGLRGQRAPWPFERLSETRGILEGVADPGSLAGPSAPPPEPPSGSRRTSGAGGPASLERWIVHISEALGIDARDLSTKRRARSLAHARAAVCWVAVARLGLPGAQVARRLGMSRSAVSRALERGHLVCRDHGLLPEETQLLNERPRDVG